MAYAWHRQVVDALLGAVSRVAPCVVPGGTAQEAVPTVRHALLVAMAQRTTRVALKLRALGSALPILASGALLVVRLKVVNRVVPGPIALADPMRLALHALRERMVLMAHGRLPAVGRAGLRLGVRAVQELGTAQVFRAHQASTPT